MTPKPKRPAATPNQGKETMTSDANRPPAETPAPTERAFGWELDLTAQEEGEWRDRTQKHRYVMVFDKSLELLWTDESSVVSLN